VKPEPGREHSQFTLLLERRVAPFFGVQFLGAFNDNVFKQALVILLAYDTATFTAMSSDTLQNVARNALVQSRMQRILERTPAAVVPLALSGLWQSLFARSRDKFRRLARLFPRIRISVGEAQASSASPETLRAAVSALRGEWR
jgi:hypothetical protein